MVCCRLYHMISLPPYLPFRCTCRRFSLMWSSNNNSAITCLISWKGKWSVLTLDTESCRKHTEQLTYLIISTFHKKSSSRKLTLKYCFFPNEGWLFLHFTLHLQTFYFHVKQWGNTKIYTNILKDNQLIHIKKIHPTNHYWPGLFCSDNWIILLKTA